MEATVRNLNFFPTFVAISLERRTSLAFTLIAGEKRTYFWREELTFLLRLCAPLTLLCAGDVIGYLQSIDNTPPKENIGDAS